MFKSIFLPLIGVAVFIIVVGLLSQGKLDFILKSVSPNLKTNQKVVKVNGVEINVEVAKSNEERAKGLSNRSSLDEKSGMVFIFPKDSKPVFWMKDTKIPLDIIWIFDNKIIGIEKNVQTEIDKKDDELKKYAAPSTSNYVLEVNAGFSDKYDIKVDQTISGLEQL